MSDVECPDFMNCVLILSFPCLPSKMWAVGGGFRVEEPAEGLCLETERLELGQGKDLEFSLITVMRTVLQLGRAGRPESI